MANITATFAGGSAFGIGAYGGVGSPGGYAGGSAFDIGVVDGQVVITSQPLPINPVGGSAFGIGAYGGSSSPGGYAGGSAFDIGVFGGQVLPNPQPVYSGQFGTEEFLDSGTFQPTIYTYIVVKGYTAPTAYLLG